MYIEYWGLSTNIMLQSCCLYVKIICSFLASSPKLTQDDNKKNCEDFVKGASGGSKELPGKEIFGRVLPICIRFGAEVF